MGAVEDLVSDSSQHVRAALGTQISGLAPILGKEESVWLGLSLITASLTMTAQNDCTLVTNVPSDAQGRIPGCPSAHYLEARACQ